MPGGSGDSSGFGLIFGILAVIVVIVLGIGVGPRIFAGDGAPLEMTVEQPARIAPAPRG